VRGAPQSTRAFLGIIWDSKEQTAEVAEDRGGLRMRDINQISAEIIDAAMKVHSARGPGLLESKLEASASLRALRGEADD
jgi:hypothetical protein